MVREGVIAAALTGLMILLFLGSWRSTLIIAISIPLAVLASIAALSALGQTLNIMTLGGLALAVGILVDDATVTIENINWHLEQGKDVRTAILDGAQQIVAPASVSLLCICIVFVPMFALGGVAGFLFVPMAEAVVFAMIASFVLSRTLVPTMAISCCAASIAHGGMSGDAAEPPPREPVGPVPARLRARFERVRAGYRGVLALALAHRRRRSSIGFLVFVVLLSFGWCRSLGQTSFPRSTRARSRCTSAPRWHPHRGHRASSIRSSRRSARSCRRTELASIVDNIGLPISGINLAYSNTGDRPAGRRHPDHADARTTSRPRLCEGLRERCRGVSRLDLRVPAGRHRQPDPELRRAGADRRAGGRPRPQRERAYANEAAARSCAGSRASPTRMQQAFQRPGAQRGLRPHSRERRRASPSDDASTSILATLAGSFQTAPTFWLNPANGVSYPIVVQTPQYRHRLAWRR